MGFFYESQESLIMIINILDGWHLNGSIIQKELEILKMPILHPRLKKRVWNFGHNYHCFDSIIILKSRFSRFLSVDDIWPTLTPYLSTVIPTALGCSIRMKILQWIFWIGISWAIPITHKWRWRYSEWNSIDSHCVAQFKNLDLIFDFFPLFWIQHVVNDFLSNDVISWKEPLQSHWQKSKRGHISKRCKS